MSTQAPGRVILIRPHHFTPNPETAEDNAFQTGLPADAPGVSGAVGAATAGALSAAAARAAGGVSISAAATAASARDEVTGLAAALDQVGVEVTVFDDYSRGRPDSVFCNNWFSTHPEGSVVLYPMYAPSRRIERRTDIIEYLKAQFRVHRVTDYSAAEHEGHFLEGTGAMVLDHDTAIAYACRSKRFTERVFLRFCAEHGYTPVLFNAVDENSTPIYHTNVMMSVGRDVALVGLSLIPDLAQRRMVVQALEASGKTVIALQSKQVRQFAGNCMEVTGATGGVLVLSDTAYGALERWQLSLLEASLQLVSVPVPTIEQAGGSVRCMMAGNHLARRHSSMRRSPGQRSPGAPSAAGYSAGEAGQFRTPTSVAVRLSTV